MVSLLYVMMNLGILPQLLCLKFVMWLLSQPCDLYLGILFGIPQLEWKMGHVLHEDSEEAVIIELSLM